MKIDIGPSRAKHRLWGTVLAILCGCALSISALAQSTVQYIHTDALGSPVAITDSAGNLVERSAFDPYGQNLGQAPMDAPGFTSHVSDSSTNLIYMQQRYYDPQIGRFLSVDPVSAYSNPTGAFSRYWYANNNPYRFTDPDGRAAKDELKPPPPPVQNMGRINASATTSRSALAASTVTLGTVRVIAERAAPTAISWISPMVGAAVAGPLLLIATPHPCGGSRCGELPAILNESQPDERDLIKVPEREGNRVAEEHGFIDAHDAKDGRGGGGVDIYKDKKNGDYWLWNGVGGGEKEVL